MATHTVTVGTLRVVMTAATAGGRRGYRVVAGRVDGRGARISCFAVAGSGSAARADLAQVVAARYELRHGRARRSKQCTVAGLL